MYQQQVDSRLASKQLQSYIFEESLAESESWTQINFLIHDMFDFASK